MTSKTNSEIYRLLEFKVEWFLWVIWIRFHHLQWKFKLLVGSLIEVIKQNIAGWCQQTFCYQNFVDNTQQAFPLIIWIFTEDEGDGIESRLHFKNFSSLHTMWWNPFWRSIYFLKNLCFHEIFIAGRWYWERVFFQHFIVKCDIWLFYIQGSTVL